jgi:hypothetical protein
MTHHQNSFFIFLSIISIVLIGIVVYFYFAKTYSPSWDENVSWDEASIKITTNEGGCPTSLPCYETYELDSELDSAGNVLHNNDLQGQLTDTQTVNIIKTFFDLYKRNACTPFYANGVTQNYELIIDKKVYEYGNNQGCKEAQEMLNTIKGAVSV